MLRKRKKLKNLKRLRKKLSTSFGSQKDLKKR